MNRPAFKNSELGLIPADWEVKRLGDCGRLLRESINPQMFPLQDFLDFSMPNYDSGQRASICQGCDMHSARILIHGKVLLFNKLNVRQKRIWVVEDCPDNAVCSSEFLPFYSKDTNLNFLSFYLATDKTTNDFIERSTGTSNSQKRITPRGFLDYLVAIPATPSEQHRIAAALSDVDAWIESLDKLIEKKKLVKQGAMQALLSGKTRLPGFSGEWVERPISDSLMPVSSPAGLIKRNVYHDAKPGTFPAFSASGQDVWLSEAAFHGDGIVVSAIGSRCGKAFLAQGDWGVVANTHVLLPKNDACMAYWFYILDNENWWLKAGTGQPYVLIQASLARTMKVPQPAEQRAIAGVLSDMDAELASLSREKVKAERIKEGMMQELLTGKTRLKGEKRSNHET